MSSSSMAEAATAPATKEKERKPTVTLRTGDGDQCDVAIQDVALLLRFSAYAIPAPGIHSKAIFDKVAAYTKKHADSGDDKEKEEEEMEAWDREFTKDADADTLYHLAMAAKHMKIQGLPDLCHQTLAAMINAGLAGEIFVSQFLS